MTEGAAMAHVIVVQDVWAFLGGLGIRNVSEMASVPATESCFRYSTAPYIISWKTDGSYLSYFPGGEEKVESNVGK